MANFSLLSTTSRVAVPFVKVTIGDYTFGAFTKETRQVIENNRIYKEANIQYPQFIKSLTVKKINGKINVYTLNFVYPITADSDPNFFEKVFSSDSETRKIIFSYGDLTTPTYLYKNEEGVITKVNNSFDMGSAVMNYTVTAISSSIMTMVGDFEFRSFHYTKPSDVLKWLVRQPKYGLRDIFTGMKNNEELEMLIPGTDKNIIIDAKTCSVFEYINYLVDSMIPIESTPSQPGIINNKHYVIIFNDDIAGKYGGPYFEVKTSDKQISGLDTYELTYGYPENNIITHFSILEDETYSILFDYADKLNPAEYKQRINDQGELEDYLKPIYSDKESEQTMEASEITWWNKVTQYPIKVDITIKGLLRPALLMSYVRLNVLFYGKRHISTGLYVVTKQVDTISDYRGFETTLSLTRIDTYNKNEFSRLISNIEQNQSKELITAKANYTKSKVKHLISIIDEDSDMFIKPELPSGAK